MPRVTVIGTGYLGPTHAVCMADLGHEVLAIDVDAEKIAKAANGEAPFFEPGLEPLLRKNLDVRPAAVHHVVRRDRRTSVTSTSCAWARPQGESGQADLSYVHAAVDSLAPHLTRACLIVGKSTVPVGTARRVAAPGAGAGAGRRRWSWPGTRSSCARASRCRTASRPTASCSA